MYESKKELVAILAAAVVVTWLISLCSCSYRANKELEKPGHWPGYLLPLYGPHEPAGQIELRNAYSDGWQDRGEAGRGEG